MSPSLVRRLSQGWDGRLAHYRRHRNDEHTVALIQEAIRYIGLHLENDLGRSAHWAEIPLWQSAAVLLFLVDRGVVERSSRAGRRVFVPRTDAESWVEGEPELRPHFAAFCELLQALRHEFGRRAGSKQA
ncbi:MAG: hypothetical protein U0790_14425 [Isosphaeraceae bacterium]